MILLGALALAFAEPVVAILPFDAHTTDPELRPLADGLPALLTTDLARAEGLTLVERIALDAVLDELALQQTEFVDPKSAVPVGQGVGATVIVTGTIATVDDALRVDARVLDVDSARILGVASASGPPEEFFVLEKVLATELLAALGVELDPKEQFALQQPATTSLPAVLAWSTGLDRVRVGETEAAVDAMRRAVAADGDFALARAQPKALRARLDAADDAKAEFTDAAYASAPEWIEACKAGDCDALADFLVVKAQTHVADPTRKDDLKRLTTQVLDAGIDEQARHLGGYRINEIALYYRFQMCSDDACRARWGTEFLERYPDSIQYDSVATRTAIAVDLLNDPG